MNTYLSKYVWTATSTAQAQRCGLTQAHETLDSGPKTTRMDTGMSVFPDRRSIFGGRYRGASAAHPNAKPRRERTGQRRARERTAALLATEEQNTGRQESGARQEPERGGDHRRRPPRARRARFTAHCPSATLPRVSWHDANWRESGRAPAAAAVLKGALPPLEALPPTTVLANAASKKSAAPEGARSPSEALTTLPALPRRGRTIGIRNPGPRARKPTGLWAHKRGRLNEFGWAEGHGPRAYGPKSAQGAEQ